jgi:hypothetical protein
MKTHFITPFTCNSRTTVLNLVIKIKNSILGGKNGIEYTEKHWNSAQ